MDFDEWTDTLLSQIDLEEREDFRLTKEQELRRFADPVSSQEVYNFQKSRIPANTEKNTKWCVGVYDSWACARNTHVSAQGVDSSEKFVFVPPLSVEITAEQLNFWLCRFVLEVRRQDGTPYPALSVKNLCSGIWRYLRDECRLYTLNFMDEKNTSFVAFRNVLDGKMKELNSTGVGVNVKRAEPVTRSEEEKLWESGTFGMNSARALFNTVYFYNCMVFGMRSAAEHTKLQVTQFQFGSDEHREYVTYQGMTCKNNQGGLKHGGKVPFCEVCQYGQPDNPRCYLKFLRKYVSCVPEEGPFYRRPLASSGDEQLRYSKQKVGIHMFERLFKTLCESAGLEKNHTGHSGKVTTATVLFDKNVDEQLVMARTGHRSKAVRLYKRTSAHLQKQVSDMLQPPAPTVTSPDEEKKHKTSDDDKISDSHDSPERKRRITLRCTNGDSVEICL